MNQLTEFFIRNGKFTLICTLFLLIGGYLGMTKLNNESFPAVDFAAATIETRYEGATPEDIETKITKPIEDEIRTVTGIKDVRSISQPSLSKLVVRVDMDNYDVQEVMADLQRSVDRVSDLPTDLQEDPEFTELKSEEFPAIELAVIGENIDRKRDLVADALKTELEDNKKILGVRLVGYTKREFRVFLDTEKLAQNHIGIEEVLKEIRARNVNIPAGDLKGQEDMFLVRAEGKIKNREELANITIRSNFSGRSILLKDVAAIHDSHSEPKILTSHNGQPATLVVVTKKGGADTLALVEETSETIKRFQATYKDEFEIVTYNNEADKVRNRTDILFSNAVTGLILVVVFLLIFLPGRIGVMASLSLPLAIFGTFGVMPFFDMNIDAITVLALVIALGMLVDNSVVISENFTRLRQNGLSPREAALKSIESLWLPITCTAMTTIAAFLPMLVTKGVMGEFIKYIPIVVTAALLFSLVESFFLLPMRLVYSGAKVQEVSETHKGDWFQGFIDKFEKFMEVCVRNRYVVAIGFLVAIATSFLFMAVFNRFELFPAEQTEIYFARVEMKRGTPLLKTQNAMEALAKKIQSKISKDWISHIVARSGAIQAGPNDPKAKDGDNVGMLTIYASDFGKYSVSHTEFLAALDKIESSSVEKLSYEKVINGPPVGFAINATFRSTDTAQLDEAIGKVRTELKKVSGVRNLQSDEVIGPSEIFVEVDFDKASRLGLNVESIGNVVRTALQGTVVSDVTLDSELSDLKEVDIRVEVDEAKLGQPVQLEELLILSPSGNLVPLSKVAKIKQRPGTPQLKRYDFKRSKTLVGQVDEAKISSQEANKKLDAAFQEISKDYPDVSIVFGGEEEDTKDSMSSLIEALGLALIGIFALLVFLFSSYLRPIIIMSTIPLGLVGFSIAFYFHGRPSSFLAMIGLIGLAGIIVNSGIVLISFIDEMREEGKLSLDEILVKASGMRLRAVLVTSLTTISGLFPTAYGIGGSDAILVPMTLAMAWGLVSGTILTIIWVPCAYGILEDLVKVLPKFGPRPSKDLSSDSSNISLLHGK